eukprot:TRINITY_DN2089_c0_g1_i1.p2 TRINITY_DN2089_c0_g1~~TRINITY_DN2089_c0_g1_i1.p2  ORF type:complete len:351 (+),score=104.96 TRINITY_DN2089_c0_g1_i1:52-1104(+)
MSYRSKTFCDQCKIWIHGSRQDVEAHQKTPRHAQSVLYNVANTQRKKVQAEKQESAMNAQILAIEAAARKSFHDKITMPAGQLPNAGVAAMAAASAAHSGGYSAGPSMPAFQVPSAEIQRAQQAQIQKAWQAHYRELGIGDYQFGQMTAQMRQQQQQQQQAMAEYPPMGEVVEQDAEATAAALAQAKQQRPPKKAKVSSDNGDAADISDDDGKSGDNSDQDDDDQQKSASEKKKNKSSSDSDDADSPLDVDETGLKDARHKLVASSVLGKTVENVGYGAWKTVSVRKLDDGDDETGSTGFSNTGGSGQPQQESVPTALVKQEGPVKFSLVKKNAPTAATKRKNVFVVDDD